MMTLNSRRDIALPSRAPSECRVGGANPASPTSRCALIAWPPSICWRIEKAIWCSRIDAPGSPTGRSTKQAVSRCAAAGDPDSDSTLTGTIERTTELGWTGSPRVSSQARNAPATVARTRR